MVARLEGTLIDKQGSHIRCLASWAENASRYRNQNVGAFVNFRTLAVASKVYIYRYLTYLLEFEMWEFTLRATAHFSTHLFKSSPNLCFYHIQHRSNIATSYLRNLIHILCYPETVASSLTISTCIHIPRSPKIISLCLGSIAYTIAKILARKMY
jgi:hypothetical protein